MLADSGRGFLRQPIVSERLYTDSHLPWRGFLMAPFSSCASVLSIARRDAACQINQIKKLERSNPGRFDRVESFNTEE